VVITGVPKDRVCVVADAVFAKPPDFLDLLATVDALVAKHQ